MGEGEDEGECPRFGMPWHAATLKGCKKCRGCDVEKEKN